MSQDNHEQLWNEYFYPDTNVLKNNLNIQDEEELREKEATMSFERLLELQEKPIQLGCGKEHLKAIHQYIFQDLYPFAGQYRKVNILKEKGTFFYMTEGKTIDGALDELFQEIEQNMMKCFGKNEFCELLGKLYTRLIYIHPFREGNGRSIREFLREFTMEKSKELGLGELELDWSKINKDELNQYIEVAHLYPGATGLLFKDALVEKAKEKKF